tara:strand:- start:217 stop:699 length:483 start_codon:yes stop_codon:yes gene_type:complete
MTKLIQDRQTGENLIVVEAGKSHSWEVLTSDGKLHKVPLTDDMLTLIIKEYNGVINTEQDIFLFFECAQKLPWEEKWWLKQENCISDNIIDMTMLDGKITSKDMIIRCPRCKSTNVSDDRFCVLDNYENLDNKPTDKRTKGFHWLCGTCLHLFRNEEAKI